MSEEAEAMEIEVPTYAVTSPDLLETMIEITELLDKVARGELTFNEAKAIYAESILPKLKEREAKYAPKKTKKSSKQKKKTTKKETKKSEKKTKTKKTSKKTSKTKKKKK